MCGCSNCCCNGGRAPERPSRPDRPGGIDPGDGPVAAFCTNYTVTFPTLTCTKSDDGFASGELEAIFTFIVNGQSQTVFFKNPALQVGVHTLNISFTATVPTTTSLITVQVLASEEDGHNYPGFTHTWGEADNWGTGSHSGGGVDDAIGYSVDYLIACADQQFAMVARGQMIDHAQRRAERRGIKNLPDDMLLNWTLRDLAHRGWKPVQVNGDEFLLTGRGTLPIEPSQPRRGAPRR